LAASGGAIGGDSSGPEPAKRFRFIAPMPRLTRDSRSWADSLRRIEDYGFHAVAISEHFSQGWAMNSLTAMDFALAATSRLRVMPLVVNNDLHHPAILAKAIATADVLSDGRAELGIGAGWLADDYRALGVALDPAAVRIERLDEALGIITAFFDGGAVTWHGRHYELTGLEALPRPVQRPRPPILVGGGGRRMLAVAARRADIVGLHPKLGTGGFDATAAAELTKDSIQRKLQWVHAAAVEAGRATPEIQFTCYDVNIAGTQVTPVRPGFSDYIAAHPAAFDDSPASLRGDVAKCVDDLVRWNEELGISQWNLGGNPEAIAAIVARLS
jgi:probable F420-dependent oxidoreductase